MIDTAPGFQRNESDVMIMSPVITNDMPPGLMRFAGTPDLVNVAVTRARSQLAMLGDRDAGAASGTVFADLASYAPR